MQDTKLRWTFLMQERGFNGMVGFSWIRIDPFRNLFSGNGSDMNLKEKRRKLLMKSY